MPAWDRVTERERQILRLLLDRHSPDEVAERLAISRTSVQRHVKHALEKLAPGTTTRVRNRPVPSEAPPSLGRILTADELSARCRHLALYRSRHRVPWAVVAVAPEDSPDATRLASLATLLRSTDSLGWHDNVLVALLPETTVHGAERLLQRLRPVLTAQGGAWGTAAAEPTDDESAGETLSRACFEARTALLEAQVRRSMGRPFASE